MIFEGEVFGGSTTRYAAGSIWGTQSVLASILYFPSSGRGLLQSWQGKDHTGHRTGTKEAPQATFWK